jgi:hypothetical protein
MGDEDRGMRPDDDITTPLYNFENSIRIERIKPNYAVSIYHKSQYCQRFMCATWAANAQRLYHHVGGRCPHKVLSLEGSAPFRRFEADSFSDRAQNLDKSTK